MKKVALLLMLNCTSFLIKAQEVPLFSQTITNSFLFNPALAGYDRGSLTLSSRQAYGQKIDGLPNTNFLSLQSPFQLGKLGFGGNILYEQLGVFNRIQANIAGSYHIRWKDDISWSLGVSSDIYSASLDDEKLNILDYDDQVIQEFDQTKLEFSAGTYFSYKFISVGLSVNRLRSLAVSDNVLAPYANIFLKGSFELSPSIMLQPIIILRKERNYQGQTDIGAYMYFNDKVLTGINYRSSGQLGVSLGYKFLSKLLVAYTYEVYSKYKIANHELTLRYDFNESKFPNTHSNYKHIQGKEKNKIWKKQLKENRLKRRNSKVVN